jgi:hypothetical protein
MLPLAAIKGLAMPFREMQEAGATSSTTSHLTADGS